MAIFDGKCGSRDGGDGGGGKSLGGGKGGVGKMGVGWERRGGMGGMCVCVS
jgi:hypothetical protein